MSFPQAPVHQMRDAAGHAPSSLMSGYIDLGGRFVIPAIHRTAERFVGGLALVKPYGGRALGYIDRTGAWVVPPTIKTYDSWSEDTAIFCVEDGRWGIVGDGRLLVAPRFDELSACHQGLLAFRDGERWGFVDRGGRVVVPAQFEAVGDFTLDGVAMAQVGGVQGLIDRSGAWRVRPAYVEALAPTHGFGRIRTDDGWLLTDAQLRPVSREAFEEVGPFIAGMARVTRDEEHSYLGANGQLLVDEWFARADLYWGGLAPVERDDEDYLLTREGKLFGPFATVMLANNDHVPMARVRPNDSLVGLMGLDGRFIVPPSYESLGGFRSDRASAKRDGKWTYLDPTGRELYPPCWDAVGEPAEGVAPVMVGLRWGVADERGQLVVAPQFDSIERFACGLAAARSVRWPPVTRLAQGVHVTPPEGLTHPGFADAGVDDELRVSICFSEIVKDDRSICMQQVLDNFIDLLEVFGGEVVEDSKWISDYSMSLRFRDVPFPCQAAQLLVTEIAGAGLPIKDVYFGRHRRCDDFELFAVRWKATPHPGDPLGPDMFGDFDEYAEAVFDEHGTPPWCESRQHLLAGRWIKDKFVYDERLFTLWRPDVRICYGVTQQDFVRPDARSNEVASVLTAALAHRFDRARVWFLPPANDPGPPVPKCRNHARGVEPMQLDLAGRERRGYLFYLDAYPLIHDVGPTVFRYREPELMEALAGVVQHLGLAPIILWQRFGEPAQMPYMAGWAHPFEPTNYAFNLFER